MRRVWLPKIRVGSFCGVVALACFACKSASERKLASEVDRLALAINQLRDAPNNRKEAPLKALEAEPCEQPAACELKQVCAQGYALHQRAIEATGRVREVLRSGKGDPEGAGQLLLLGEEQLTRAKELIARCTSLQGELVRETR